MATAIHTDGLHGEEVRVVSSSEAAETFRLAPGYRIELVAVSDSGMGVVRNEVTG